MNRIKSLLGVAVLSAISVLALADGRQGCADATEVSRLETLLAIQTLQVELLSHASATETLERWCASQGLAYPALITVERVRDSASPADLSARQALGVGAETRLGYRHVRLKCGSVVLSEADNWYLPERLTPSMNRTLKQTDTPFGKVVKPLGFSRHTLSSTLLWPRPGDPDALTGRGSTPPSLPYFLFEHRALLKTADGLPLSLVTERYTRNVLKDFASQGKSLDP